MRVVGSLFRRSRMMALPQGNTKHGRFKLPRKDPSLVKKDVLVLVLVRIRVAHGFLLPYLAKVSLARIDEFRMLKRNLP